MTFEIKLKEPVPPPVEAVVVTFDVSEVRQLLYNYNVKGTDTGTLSPCWAVTKLMEIMKSSGIKLIGE